MNIPLPPEPEPSTPTAAGAPKTYRAGTLTYTTASLTALFFWLLWGDFYVTIMEAVWHSIVPLKIKELQAPNWAIGAIMVSIPQVLNTILNPIISTASDRYRGRWGRRRPFMLIATPFISIFLCLVGISPDIGKWIFEAGLGQSTGWSLGAITVGVIAITIFFFRIAELFVGTLFYYYFNDVVPQKVMGRFLAMYRVVGTGAGALYNYFVYEHALTHMRIIFLVAGVLFFIGFMLMCWQVKEGDYPPPTAHTGKKGVISVVKNYAKECLHQRLFILLYLHVMVWSLSGACETFQVFLNQSLGMTLKQLGTIAAAVSVATSILTYPAGMLVDRIHPMRLMIGLKVGIAVLAPLHFIWLFTNYPPATNFWILVGLSALTLPLNVIYQATLMPLYMRLYPREKFGQFCSFMAVCHATVGVIAGFAGGIFIDWMRRFFPEAVYGKDYCYRMIPLWRVTFVGLALILLFMLFKEWKRLGGENYVAHEDTGDEPTQTGLDQAR